MNPAFIALGAANPGLMPLAFSEDSGYSGNLPPKTARQLPDGHEEWEEKLGTLLGIAGIVFLIILTSNMAPT